MAGKPAGPKTVMRGAIEDKLAIWQQRLELLDWDIYIDWEEHPENSEASAEIHVHSQYDRAVVLFAAGWEEWPLAGCISPTKLGGNVSVDYLICHELLHALMRDLDHIPMVDIEGHLHRDAHEVMINGYIRHREHLVDRVARSLVDGWGNA